MIFSRKELNKSRAIDLLPRKEIPTVSKEIPRIVLNDKCNVVLQLVVENDSDEDKLIVQDLSISPEMTMKILSMIGYGNIGWERYNIVTEKKS